MIRRRLRRNRPRLAVTLEGKLPRVATVADRLEVMLANDGDVVIVADSTTAARLAGRKAFGFVTETQAELEDKIAAAWYSAGCPEGAYAR